MTMKPQPGHECPKCGHYLTVVDSKRRGGRRVRYVGCDNRSGRRGCGYRPPGNASVVPLDALPGRKVCPTSRTIAY